MLHCSAVRCVLSADPQLLPPQLGPAPEAIATPIGLLLMLLALLPLAHAFSAHRGSCRFFLDTADVVIEWGEAQPQPSEVFAWMDVFADNHHSPPPTSRAARPRTRGCRPPTWSSSARAPPALAAA